MTTRLFLKEIITICMFCFSSACTDALDSSSHMPLVLSGCFILGSLLLVILVLCASLNLSNSRCIVLGFFACFLRVGHLDFLGIFNLIILVICLIIISHRKNLQSVYLFEHTSSRPSI